MEAEVRVFDKNLADMKVADRLKAMENFTGRTRCVFIVYILFVFVHLDSVAFPCLVWRIISEAFLEWWTQIPLSSPFLFLFLSILTPLYRKVLVKAKVVVSAAGSLHTPALLLRSNITHHGKVCFGTCMWSNYRTLCMLNLLNLYIL